MIVVKRPCHVKSGVKVTPTRSKYDHPAAGSSPGVRLGPTCHNLT